VEGRQVDAAIALNGRLVFALTDQGYLLIYEPNGTLKDKIFLGKGVDGIKATPREDVLLTSNSKNGVLQVITLDFIHEIETSGSPSQGPADAPVEIVVFSDFQCPACAALVPILEQVREKYPQKVKVVFKNYPLRSHRYARPAAAAALAAEKQGKFWQFHDLLFKNYQKLNPQKIQEIAQESGLDVGKLQKDVNDATVLDKLNSDISEAARVGIRGTPTLFINGRIVRTRTLEGIQKMIDKALKSTLGRVSRLAVPATVSD
jgi:protein-disulfide isomerase